ncbi:hypothetical protein [Gluconobacter oxydans]|uniref:hypothetical protein n=1 Tax=Gluconobacter oxydans TaxID=442 RepID=UPI00062C3C96|nr:hypothetical protein [Gluconobacter oxydans]
MSSSDATTSVPAASLTDAGFVAPAETDILAGVLADITAALGGNVNQALTTPQGQLAQSETAIIGDCNDRILSVFNGIDPRTASGRMQDAIGFIYFLTRNTGEGRADFEYRRQNSVGANSQGMNASVLGSLLSVPGVTDAYVVDNQTSQDTAIGGVAVSAHSIYCCVAGAATSASIGLAIFQKKSPGCGYTGSVSVTVQDPAAVYNGNGPFYSVKYDEATDTPIYFVVQIVNSSSVPSNAASLVQSAIVSAFTSGEETVRPRIGGTILAGRYYCVVGALGDWAAVEEITIGTTAEAGEMKVGLNINQAPSISAANITVELV